LFITSKKFCLSSYTAFGLVFDIYTFEPLGASNVTIVTAKDIEEKGAQNLVDALRMVPGVMVKNYYGNITFDIGGYSSVHAERNSIITYDGVRISSKEVANGNILCKASLLFCSFTF